MSFRGFQKSVVRAPQHFKQRFNIGEQTKDAVFIDSELRFQDLETETKRLHDESKKYFKSINDMLTHQIEFSRAIAEIYKPISGRVSDPDSLVVHCNPEGIQACEEYEAIVRDLQETLAPELEMITSRVIQPANELLEILKAVRKCATKREHKKVDFDRRSGTLKKLQEKQDKTPKDEKAIWKAESDLEQATQDFNYFNDLLKEELPKLFALEREFIQPLFQSFYYMQLNIFYTLHEKMQGCDIGYFDLTREIEEAFEDRRGDIREQAEKLGITRFKTSGRPKPIKYGQKPQQALESGSQPAGLLTAGNGSDPSIISSKQAEANQEAQSEASASAPPPYSPQPAAGAFKSPKSPPIGGPVSPGLASAAAAKAKPPPPKPKPKNLAGNHIAAETVTALYDYSAQAAGDLTFQAGDVIEIVTRTQNENEWWVGKCHGNQGQFPGNYVRLN